MSHSFPAAGEAFSRFAAKGHLGLWYMRRCTGFSSSKIPTFETFPRLSAAHCWSNPPEFKQKSNENSTIPTPKRFWLQKFADTPSKAFKFGSSHCFFSSHLQLPLFQSIKWCFPGAGAILGFGAGRVVVLSRWRYWRWRDGRWWFPLDPWMVDFYGTCR